MYNIAIADTKGTLMSSDDYASERDFVARYLLRSLEDALKVVGVENTVDIYIEKSVDGGTPDLSVECAGRGLFLIEAKFKKKVGHIIRDIEPRDPAVIEQAVRYAAVGGYPFYATCNAKRLILYRFTPGVRAYESEVLSVDFAEQPNWAKELFLIAFGKKEARLKAPDDSVVDTLLEAFDDIYPEFTRGLDQHLKNARFRKRFENWLSSQGLESNDETHRLIAQQTAYLQINKLLFYQAIRTIYPDKLPPLHITEEQDVSERLAELYAAARKIDYLPIYQMDILSEISLTERSKTRIRTLVDTIATFDFVHTETDFIGRLYEKLIPTKERKRLGQFYTPPYIVDLITQLTIKNKDAKVFDPGCGSGGFLIKSYQRLRELKGIPKREGGISEKDHNEILGQVFGVDINQFPAHLSVVNLAIQSPKAKVNKINVAVKDFFDTRPGVSTLMGFQSFTTDGEQASVDLPTSIDVVVANPPYIRQELVGENEKLKIKKALESDYKDRLFVGATVKAKKDAIILGKQSDIYVYFFVHALKYLRNNGTLGFITSNKWLEVGYGEPLQDFLLRNSAIRYVVEIDKAIFPDIEVDTVVTILQKTNEPAKRESNHVKFLRLKKMISVDDLVNLLTSVDTERNNDSYRLTLIPQQKITPGKWTLYLRAPEIYWKIQNHDKMSRLDIVAEDVFYGMKTGCDPYFILSNEEAKEHGIERRYLKPCVPAGNDIEGLTIDPEAINQYFFMVPSDDRKIRESSTWKYIQYGERLTVEPAKRRKDSRHLVDIETVKSRSPWFSLPDLPIPNIVFPMWFRYKFRAFLNQAEARGTNYYIYVVCKDDIAKSLAAYLNSSPVQLCLELLGRQYSGMLHMMVYELQGLPVLNISKLSKEERKKLANAFDDLSSAKARTYKLISKKKKPAKISNDNEEKMSIEEEKEEVGVEEQNAQSKLDDIIFDILGFSDKQRQAVLKGLVEMRELRRARTR